MSVPAGEFGIVGLGRIGAGIAHLAIEKGMRVVGMSRSGAPRDSRQILDLMGRFGFAVGMRLHFLIFAALRGTPFSPLPYASKVAGLLEDLGMDTPGIGELIGRIDRKWDTRKEIRARLGERVPPLRERARLINQSFLRLLAAAR